MVPSDVCPTEDAIKIFIEHLVDPLLPAKSSVQDYPSPSQQKLVARQVRSVVLLYNYYQRKRHPQLEYLPLNEFSKLVVVLRPALLAYMQFMQNSHEEELTNVEKQLSLTEKMIMEACDVSKSLDASKNVPNIEGWPITKVAILLIDSKKEKCFLLFGSITSGVWSLVEKSLDTSSQSSLISKDLDTSCQSSLGLKGMVTSNQSSEVTPGTKQYKKKRVLKKSSKDELKVNEDVFLQVGYSAIKEATGINNTDIFLLESGTMYSESKEKEASRFYIMQCSETINEEVFEVPIQDLIKSLQGPLVTKSSGSWMITPVMDYFHVLPCYEIISKWISREAFSNTLQDTRVTEKNIKVDTPEVTEFYVNEDMFTAHDSKPNNDNIDSPKQKENTGSCTLALSDSIYEPMEMTMNENSILKSKIKEKYQYIIDNTVQVDEDLERNNPCVKYNFNGPASTVKALNVDSTNMLVTEGGTSNLASLHNSYANRPNISPEKGTVDGRILISNHSASDQEELKVLSDSKKILTQTALATLIRRRNELALQQRKIEDEIAVCDGNIQKILSDGEDNFRLKIESIIEGCNGTWLWNQERVCGQQIPPLKRKKLSEAVFITQSSCQELDDICRTNNWVLPTYHLSQSEGGFKANVTVKGVEFQCSFEGKMGSSPSEARESAAVQMITNLRSIAKLEE
ncbi:uncharacterized protein LOC124831357 [Vigna umbellata]|uniref:uncharacterized protein LOC124831357 n=1 Tax=Vigna umbellata TaxID=87088 RepID=UPI001F5EB6E7|nr:uncharacterized protein LOC124831357 [Vigna umbellata]XP_047161288.1 uncharacterized protein LOC124831357 [Vigna umbellata]